MVSCYRSRVAGLIIPLFFCFFLILSLIIVPLLFFVFFFLIQRAKIGPGKNAEGKSPNAASRFDSNGNQDRMKLSDFNFLMVLGKGSFGKVGTCQCLSSSF